MAFSIFFSGLICHEGPNEERGSDRKQKTRTSILKDPKDHTPYITGSTFSEVLKTRVTFKGLESGSAVPDKLFTDEQHVPHLEDMTFASVKLEKRSPALRVIIPGGRFTVAKYFDHQAKYHLDGALIGPSCVAEYTLLLSNPTGSKVEVTFNKKTVQLDPDSWLLIENASNGNPEPAGSHFKKNFRFTNGSDIDIATIEETKIKCTASATESPWLATVIQNTHSQHDDPDTQSECSNSQWP